MKLLDSLQQTQKCLTTKVFNDFFFYQDVLSSLFKYHRATQKCEHHLIFLITTTTRLEPLVHSLLLANYHCVLASTRILWQVLNWIAHNVIIYQTQAAFLAIE